MIPPPDTQRRQSQNILNALVNPTQQAKLQDILRSVAKDYNTEQKMLNQVLHLLKQIEENINPCYRFMKQMIGKQIHKKSNSMFLNTVLILIVTVYSHFQKKHSEQPKESEKSQKCFTELNKSSEENQLSRLMAEQKQIIDSSLSSEKSVDLHNISRNLDISSRNLDKTGTDKNHIDLNNASDYAQFSNVASNQIHDSSETTRNRQEEGTVKVQQPNMHEVDWYNQTVQLIEKESVLVQKVIIPPLTNSQRKQYIQFLVQKCPLSRPVNSQSSITNLSEQDLQKAFQLFCKLVKQDKIQDIFQPQLYCFIMKNYSNHISQKTLTQNARTHLRTSKHVFYFDELKTLSPDILERVGYYYYQQKNLPHKAYFYAKQGYEANPKNEGTVFLYGAVLKAMGCFKKAAEILNFNYEGDYKHFEFCLWVEKAYIQAQLRNPKNVQNLLKTAEIEAIKACRAEYVRYMGNVDSCQERMTNIADINQPFREMKNIRAYSWLKVGNYQKAIDILTNARTFDSIKRRIYLAWAYFQLKQYRHCQAQLMLIKNEDIQRMIDPLEYVQYFKQFERSQKLSTNFRDKMEKLTERASKQLQCRAGDSQKYAKQLFRRKYFGSAFLIMQYINKKLKPYIKNQEKLEQKLYVYKCKAFIQFDAESIKNYTWNELKILKKELLKMKENSQISEQLYKQYLFWIAQAYFRQDSKKGISIFKVGLQNNLNLFELKIYLLKLKEFASAELQNVEQWLFEKLEITSSILKEIHLQLGDIFKELKQYQKAIWHYQQQRKQMQQRKQQQQRQQQRKLHQSSSEKLLLSIYECYFYIADQQLPQAKNYLSEMKEQIKKHIKKMKNDVLADESQFLREIRKIMLKYYNEKRQAITNNVDLKNVIKSTLYLLLMTITYDEIEFCKNKLVFVVSKKLNLFLKCTFQKKLLKMEFLRVIQKFAEVYQVSSKELIKKMLRILENEFGNKLLLPFYNQAEQYEKMVSIFIYMVEGSNSKQLEQLKTQIVPRKGQEKHIEVLLRAILLQKTGMKNSTIWQIICKQYLSGKSNEKIIQWKACLYAQLVELSSDSRRYLLQYYNNGL